MNRKSFYYVGLSFVLCIVAMGLLSVIYTPYDPEAADSASRLLKPSLKHLFGTDRMGRDVFSRCLVGAGTTVLVSASIVAIGAVGGTITGAVTGYFGGIADEILMRINDGLASFPSVLLALIFVSLFGSNTRSVVIVLGILFVPSFARVVRSEYMREKEKDYVKSMSLYGAGSFRIMFVHILPNITPSLVAAIAIGINNAILAEASLSYLGLGVQPPAPSLGRMLSEGQIFIFSAPWICLFPGLVIVISVLGVSMISGYLEEGAGSSVRDISRRRIREFIASARSNCMTDCDKAALINESVEVLPENGAGSDKSGLPDTDNDKPVLSVNSLSVAVNNGGQLTKVVDNLSFQLKKGEILGIVGESGSGKSISMASVMGLLGNRAAASISGSIGEIDLSCISRRDYKALRGKYITQVFQDPLTSLNPSKKIKHTLNEILINHPEVKLLPEYRGKSSKTIIMENLAEAGLSDTDRIYESYPHELSGGQRQRVLIALCLISRPKILILDEPTTAIDKSAADKIIENLKELHKRYGMAVILISHDLGVVRALCSRVIVMKNGAVVERGSIEKVFDNPDNDYTRELKDAAQPVNYVKPGKTSEKVVLSVENLCVSYKKRKGLQKKSILKVIENLSFELHEGETLGICGDSGSGKTTVLKAVTGNVAYSGIINRKGRLAMVFQDPYSSLNPKKKVENLILEVYNLMCKKTGRPGISRKDGRKITVDALTSAGLSEKYLTRYPSELSGGERQRVCIAMALAVEPDIILLDEPVTSLDVTIQAKILKLLAELKEEKKLSYILISHNQEIIKNMCDRSVYLEK